MPDIISGMLDATRVGTALGATIANNNARLQQLRSEDAERKVRERLYNQQMSDLIFKHDQMVQKQADMTKALARVQLESSSPIAGFMPSAGGGVTPVQNPNYTPFEESMLKNVGPVMQKYGDDAGLRDLYYGKRVADQSRMDAIRTQAQANLTNARPEMEADKINAANQRNQDRINARMGELEQRHQNALDLLEQAQTGREKLQEMRNTARLAISQGEVSREQWLNRHMNTTVSAIQNTKLGSKLPIKDIQAQAMQLLGDAWDMEIGSRRGESTTTKPAPSKIRKYNPATGRIE